MKWTIVILAGFLLAHNAQAQNVGIGTSFPTEKLEVIGHVKASGLVLTQGNKYDVAKKGAGDSLVFSKSSRGIGLNYIIAIDGIFPQQGGGTVTYSNVIMGEIRLFAGNFPPKGFMFCNGQLMSINNNLSLFAILGTTYGGDGTSSFALPDLRGAVPVGFGAPANGSSWLRGEVN